MNDQRGAITDDVDSFLKALDSTISLVEENQELFESSAGKIITALILIIQKFLDSSIKLEEAQEKTRSLMIAVPNTVIAKGNADINQCLRELTQILGKD